MSILADIKMAVKTILDATGLLGIVYTQDRAVLERMPAVTMWSDGFAQEPGPDKTTDVTYRILIRVHVALKAGQESKTQNDVDALVPAVMDALRRNPRLDTGAGPIVFTSILRTGDISVDLDQRNPRIVAEMLLEAIKEEV